MKFGKSTFTLCYLMVFLCSFFSLNAQTIVWEGNVSDSWENPDNWAPNQVPTAGNLALVLSSPASGVFPVISVNTTIDFTIQNFGTITLDAVVANNGSFTNFGNATIINKGVFTNLQNITYQNGGFFTNEGTFENEGALSNFGSAHLVNDASGNLINRAGASITNFGTITNTGAVLNEGNILNTAILNNDGVIQNESFIQNGITAYFNNNATGVILNNGAFEIGGFFNNSGTFVNEATVVVNSSGTLTNDGEFQNLLDFSNNSGLLINNGRYINVGILNNNFGGIINNYGNFENVVSTSQNGTLEIFECSFLYQYSQIYPIAGQVWNFGVIYILGAPVNYTPMTGSVELYSLDESPTPEAICQDVVVTLDASGNATVEASGIDGGSSALYCVINGITLDMTSFDCSHVGPNTVTLTVEDFYGNTASCQANVEVLPSSACDTPSEYCTFTQGFYGNEGGIQFGQTTLEIIQDALSDGNGNNQPIILGGGSRTLQIDLEAAQCVIDLLPGGGSPKELPNENNVLGASCNTGSIPIKNGRFDNILLAQTLTLALNTRYDENLSSLALSDACTFIPNSIYTALGGNATIGDLLAHANDVLGGGNTQELSDIPEALGNINDYFDECRAACTTSSSSNLLSINLGINQTASATELYWVTNAEDKNDNFIIEHSTDGVHFSAIKEVSPRANNTGVEFYDAIDTEPVEGNNLYRIKEIFEDGSFQYSNIEVVNFTANLDAIRIHPNPTTESIFVETKPFEGIGGTIQIYDGRGHRMYQESFNEFSPNSQKIDLDNYREGIYFLTIQAEGKKMITKRFMVGNVK